MTPEVCYLCPVYSVISFWSLSLQKIPLPKDRMLKTEAGFSLLFLAISGYSIWTLIQNVWRFEVVSEYTFKATLICDLEQLVDPLLAWTNSIHLAYSQMGHGSIPSQFGGQSFTQPLLKTEIGDHALTRIKKALAQFLKISANIGNMSKITVFTRHPHNSSLALKAVTLSADLNTVILPCNDRLSSLRRLNISHR